MFTTLKNLFSSKPNPQLAEYIENGAYLLDVRSRQEFESGHSKNSINIPLEQLQQKIGKMNNNKPVVVFCRSGNRSAVAKTILEKNGFKNVVNAGSWQNISSIMGSASAKGV